ncbi:MAG: NAD(P)H-hydrate dehydratase [Cypionkella sp.]
MTELLTAAQMRAIEAAAIASGEATGLELMERAGAGVVEAVFEEWPELRASSFRAVVLCGPGNNGGDGFVVARLLKEWGWGVEVFLYGDAAKLPPDARVNYERWVAMGEVFELSFPTASEDDYDSFMDSAYRISETALVVDALFGIGFKGDLLGLEPLLAGIAMYEHVQDLMPARCVSIDIPSGLFSDSGQAVVGPKGSDLSFVSVRSRLTVTFHLPKLGHFLGDGPLAIQKLVTKDIGLLGSVSPDTVRLVERPRALGKRAGHKFSHGHAMILSGPPGHGGATRMTARGALRIGAGLVTLACPPEALAENAWRLDAIMLKTVADAVGLEEILVDTRINALCLGPGLGINEETRSHVAAALRSGRAMVLDADALTLIARDATLFAALHQACVLTPHGGEFARLFPDLAVKLSASASTGPAYSKVDATREAAARAGCVVLYKGADTVIASPDGTCAINSAQYDRAAPWLATAGSGDVLSGYITGLLARGFAPQQAAETGAWLHVECARSFGPGLIAEDLPEELPKVFRALGV